LDLRLSLPPPPIRLLLIFLRLLDPSPRHLSPPQPPFPFPQFSCSSSRSPGEVLALHFSVYSLLFPRLVKNPENQGPLHDPWAPKKAIVSASADYSDSCLSHLQSPSYPSSECPVLPITVRFFPRVFKLFPAPPVEVTPCRLIKIPLLPVSPLTPRLFSKYAPPLQGDITCWACVSSAVSP